MKKILILLFFAAFVCKTTGSFAQATNVQDSLALVDLYNNTDGAHWRFTWNLTYPVSTWYGVTLVAGRVTEIYLNQDNLSGSIPSSLGNLFDLQHLDLSTGYLTGNIPPTLGNLTNLNYLSLENNSLSGSMPSSLGNLSQLDYLNLSINGLSGSIPSAFVNLSKLTDLYLNSNKFKRQYSRLVGQSF